MAKRTWNVTTDEGTFNVDLAGSKLTVNGETVKLNKLAKKTHFVDTEYTVPLGNRSATLVMQSMAAPILAYNGTNCATGEPWQYQGIPAWGWVFFVLDIIAIFVSGWLWALIAILVTAVVIRSSLNTGVKIVLSLLLTVAAFAIGFIVAGALVAAGAV